MATQELIGIAADTGIAGQGALNPGHQGASREGEDPGILPWVQLPPPFHRGKVLPQKRKVTPRRHPCGLCHYPFQPKPTRDPGYQLRSSRKLILDQVELKAANVNTPGAQVTLSAAVPYDR